MSMIYSTDFNLVRTPFFPFQNILSEDIIKLLEDVNFKEALNLSSPNLLSEVEKYFNNTFESKEKEKLELSIYRYYLRMCYRCTPFGMFAGISLGTLSDSTVLQLQANTHYKKNTRLDTHFLSSVAQEILKDSVVRNSIKWYANNTSYRVSNKLRYIEYRIDKDSRSHHLANVDHSEHLSLILNNAMYGATIGELASALVSDDISLEEAVNFVNEMIASCLLVSELEPLVTGVEYHIQLVEKLKKINTVNKHLQELLSLTERLREMDKEGIGISMNIYNNIILDVKNLKIEFDPGKLFQCDLLKTIEKCCINNKIITELNNSIFLLNKVIPLVEHTNLKTFTEEFEKRYEMQEISLLSVLDPDTGIGYPVKEQLDSDNTPLLLNLQVKNVEQNQSTTYTDSKWSRFLLQKIQEASRNNLLEIEIIDDEIITIVEDKEDGIDILPTSVYTLCSLLSSSVEEVDRGNFLVYHEVTGGPSAACLFGRFCHMDTELTRLTLDVLEKEEQTKPDCVFAEILHIAQARLGNVLMRPILRKYEIPILTRPAVDEEHTILLSDLMVSVRNGRIFLRSKKLNKEVIPRLTTAHNFSMNSVPHYHFLGDLQYQGIKSNLSWNWGMLNEFPFLPRVLYGKTILAKARWILNLSDLSKNKEVKETELIEPIKKFFAQNNLPNRVTISQGDNLLPIDIENSYCLKILAKDIKKYETLILQECLFNENNLLVKGPEGSFTNEIVIPWHRPSHVKNTATQTHQYEETISPQRNFQPGSEWHYIKIYCGVKTADKILTEALKPIIESLMDEGIITKWFFIRYADPDHHLRIRFAGTGNYYAEVTERLNQALSPYLENHLIWKIQTDTYNRELERYGAENMENSETIFFYDSIATVQILSLLEGDEGDDLRWQFALKGVDDLLNSFGYNLLAKRDLIEVISNSFMNEFNADNKESRNQLSLKYRETKGKIHLALQNELEEPHEFYSIWQIFKERSKSIAPHVVYIDNLYDANKLSIPKSDLMASYIHMFLNRFLRSKQRLQELVIYYLLHQHYRSLFAREAEEVKRTTI